MQISGLSLFTLWFGAAVSLAEIITGSLIAPLGLTKGITIILLGHLVGGLFLGAAAYIGQKEKKASIESSRFSLGRQGSYLISLLNIIQLIGWTAIMLIQASKAMQPISQGILGFESFKLFVVILGFLVLLWSLFMEKGSKIINEISVALLMILSLIMLYLSWGQTPSAPVTGEMSIGMAFELSLVMPLSWTPLIADYTQKAKSSRGAVWGSYAGYFIGSSLMYIIGLVCAINLGSSDPTSLMMKLNLGFAALMVVILATVTTTFMDVYSAVISTNNIFKKLPRNWTICAYTLAGTVLALFFPMQNYENFLYMIGSVFAPTFTVLFVDYFFFKKDHSEKRFNYLALATIALGIAFYYLVSKFDLMLGASLPTIGMTAFTYVILHSLLGVFQKDKVVTE